MSDFGDEFKEKMDDVKEDAQSAYGDIKEKAQSAYGDIKEKAESAYGGIKEGAQSAYGEIREEAQEVIQEARAAVSGTKLDTADTVGGAGYRADNSASSTKAIVSLVLGILSLICAFFGKGAILGLIFGIVGVVLGAKARKEAQTGIATGGFVCSLIGLILCAIGLVCVIACAGAVGALSALS